MKQDGISVILPTLNEKENLLKLIPQIVCLFEEKIAVDYEILVVDDGSNDGTADLIYEISIKNSNVKLITRTKEKSLPLSILEGINSSYFDNVMWLDADGSMTVKAMEKLLIKFYENNKNAVVGSRFAEGGGYKGVKNVKEQSIFTSIKNVKNSQDSVIGMLLSILINKLLSGLSKSNLTDLTSGFIVLQKKHIEDEIFINKNYGEYFIYLIKSLLDKKVIINEVGYICETRMYGESKTSSGIIRFIITGIPYLKAATKVGR